jgi:phosphopantothenoylcysteine synthetase/decarboxylase
MTDKTTKGAMSTADPVETTPADPAATAEAESRTGSRSPIVRFGKDFDYTWPSRAMTNYPAGFQGRVKAEVADAAQAAGVLVDPVDEPAETA